MKTVGLISLGCAKNRVDAERILGGLAERGFTVVDDPADAEVVVVNTCGFIRDAVEESIEEILGAAKLKVSGNCKILAVAGCLVKRYPEMTSELPEVDHFFTPDEIGKMADVITGFPDAAPRPLPARLLTTPPHSTYLKIADGCSNLCHYCTIPSIRGAFRSFDADMLVDEARALCGQGAVELNLVAQDVTSYGSDLGNPRALIQLIERLEKIDGLAWIRLLYAYPRALPPGIIEALAGSRKVVPYLDVPIQHAHPRVLKAMGRKTGADEMADFFEDLKEKLPGLVLRTTAIVGYPGETEEEFAALMSFAEKVRFHHLGVFVYSPEEGTPAAKMKGRVRSATAWKRRDRLMELQAGISGERLQAFVGETLNVLVEGFDEEGDVVGRFFGQAPEVDGLVRFTSFADDIVEIGKFVRARITGSDAYDLTAEPSES